MSQPSRSFPDRRVLGWRISAIAAGAGMLVVAGVSSTGVAASPDPLSTTISVSGACALERIGTQFVKCDNLTGGGVRAPAFVPERVHLGLKPMLVHR